MGIWNTRDCVDVFKLSDKYFTLDCFSISISSGESSWLRKHFAGGELANLFKLKWDPIILKFQGG